MAAIPPQLRMLTSAYKKASGGSSAPSGSGSKPSAMLYLGLAMIALLKDLLDLVVVGSFPGIGTVVTACFSFLIWMLMTLFDRSGGKSNNKMVRSLVLAMLSLVEAVGFGLNFLPIETLTVMMLYMMARSAYQKEEQRSKQEEQARNRANQIQAARLQAQIAEQAQYREQAAANDATYQQEAANDAQYQDNPARKIV